MEDNGLRGRTGVASRWALLTAFPEALLPAGQVAGRLEVTRLSIVDRVRCEDVLARVRLAEQARRQHTSLPCGNRDLVLAASGLGWVEPVLATRQNVQFLLDVNLAAIKVNALPLQGQSFKGMKSSTRL